MSVSFSSADIKNLEKHVKNVEKYISDCETELKGIRALIEKNRKEEEKESKKVGKKGGEKEEKKESKKGEKKEEKKSSKKEEEKKSDKKEEKKSDKKKESKKEEEVDVSKLNKLLKAELILKLKEYGLTEADVKKRTGKKTTSKQDIIDELEKVIKKESKKEEKKESKKEEKKESKEKKEKKEKKESKKEEKKEEEEVEDISLLSKQKLIEKLKEFGVDAKTVKRTDGKSGAPRAEDLIYELRKTMEQKTVEVTSESSENVEEQTESSSSEGEGEGEEIAESDDGSIEVSSDTSSESSEPGDVDEVKKPFEDVDEEGTEIIIESEPVAIVEPIKEPEPSKKSVESVQDQFENVTEKDFEKYVKGLSEKEFVPNEGAKHIAGRINLPQATVAIIMTRYSTYKKKWPYIIKACEELKSKKESPKKPPQSRGIVPTHQGRKQLK